MKLTPLREHQSAPFVANLQISKFYLSDFAIEDVRCTKVLNEHIWPLCHAVKMHKAEIICSQFSCQPKQVINLLRSDLFVCWENRKEDFHPKMKRSNRKKKRFSIFFDIFFETKMNEKIDLCEQRPSMTKRIFSCSASEQKRDILTICQF